MAKIHGRARRALPPSLVQDLTRLGFVYREEASADLSFFIWQHKKWPTMRLHVVRANTPGSIEIAWQFEHTPVSFTTEEALIRRLESTISFKTNPNQFLADVEAQHGR